MCFSLVPKFLDATIRHFHFMLEGLREVDKVGSCYFTYFLFALKYFSTKELTNLNIQFFLLTGFAKDTIPKFIEKNNLGALIVDFSPLRVCATWLDDVKKSISPDVPIVQVDSHNIVPCWIGIFDFLAFIF